VGISRRFNPNMLEVKHLTIVRRSSGLNQALSYIYLIFTELHRSYHSINWVNLIVIFILVCRYASTNLGNHGKILKYSTNCCLQVTDALQVQVTGWSFRSSEDWRSFWYSWSLISVRAGSRGNWWAFLYSAF